MSIPDKKLLKIQNIKEAIWRQTVLIEEMDTEGFTPAEERAFCEAEELLHKVDMALAIFT